MTEQANNHKWMVLSNTTLGMLAATINASIVLISLPAIFRGIGLHPLDPSNTNILLWTIMGYMVVTSVLVVTFGKLGDMFGRAKIYNLGFLIFTFASIALSFMPTGPGAAWFLVGMRIVQGIGGAMLTSTATAILIDVFPTRQRGLALGINTMAAISEGPEKVGERVAAALTGTLLGIWVAYGFVNPLANRIKFNNAGDEQYLKCIKQAVAGFAKGLAPMTAVEIARRSLDSNVQPGASELEATLKAMAPAK